MKTESLKRLQIVGYVDGRGCTPDGTGSGYSYENATTGVRKVKFVDGLTNNQAEYRGLLFFLHNVKRGSEVLVYTDSQLMCYQFNGDYRVHDPELARLLARVRAVIEKRNLEVQLKWIPREKNLAGRLL